MKNRAVKELTADTKGAGTAPFTGLQLFAGDGGNDGGEDDPEEDDPGDDPDDDDGDDDEEGPSFDEFLKAAGNQAEFDKRVREAVSAAVSDERKKWKSITDSKLSEAEKLTKMTKEEKAEYLREKERQEFEAEKAEFEREKLLVEVKKELQEQVLPAAFADALVTISDAEKIKAAISEIKKAWDEGITEAVKAKARQTTPTESGHVIRGSSGMAEIRKMASKNRIIKN